MQQKLMRLEAPDGGWGWVVLFAAVTVNFLIPGTIKSFGVLFVEYVKVFHASPTQASWMPALCYFLYSSFGPLASILSMKYSYRTVTLIGGLCASSGLMISYFANSVMYLYFSYGIMVGMGAGLTFPVAIYIVSEYFDKRRGLATGLCISGSAIGTIVLSPFLQYLLDHLGYRGAVLIMGGIILNTTACALLYHPVERHMKFLPIEETDQCEKETEQSPKNIKKEYGDLSSHRSSIASVVGSVTLDPRRLSMNVARISLMRKLAKEAEKESTVEEVSNTEEEENQRLFDLAILKDPLYLVILISNSTSAISNTNFMILLPTYAVSEGFNSESSALLLSIVSVFDLIGRIGGAALSDINLMPKHYYFVSGLGLSGVALGLLTIGNGYMYIASFCAIFGLSSGLYIGTTAVVLTDMLGPESLASSYGISLFVNGLLQLIGPPLCNLTFEYIGSYKPIFVALGIILVCGTSLWGFLPFIKKNNKNNNNENNENNAKTECAA